MAKHLAFLLSRMGSHWKIASRKGIKIDLHFSNITLTVLRRLGDRKMRGRSWLKPLADRGVLLPTAVRGGMGLWPAGG